jgi:hypothetical protein
MSIMPCSKAPATATLMCQVAHLYQLHYLLCEVLAFVILLEPGVCVQPKTCNRDKRVLQKKAAVRCGACSKHDKASTAPEGILLPFEEGRDTQQS